MKDQTAKQAALKAIKSHTKCEDFDYSGQIIKARKCTIYQVKSPTNKALYAVKVYCGIYANGEQSQLQYEALVHAHKRLLPPYSVVPPVAYLADHQTIIMGWVSAKKLKQVLLANITNPKMQNHLIKQTMLWANMYHQINGIDHDLYEKAWRRGQNRLQYLRDTRGITNRQLAKYPHIKTAAEFIDSIPAQYFKYPVPTAILHGDFTPTNILITPNQTIGIDLWGYQRKPILNDIIRMCVYLSLNIPFMRGSKNPYEWRVVKLMHASYGENFYPDHKEIFLYALLLEYVRRSLVTLGSQNRSWQGLKKAWTLDRMNKIIAEITKQIRHL